MIGLMTALIGDIATIFGCLISLKPEVTAITFVALGNIRVVFAFIYICLILQFHFARKYEYNFIVFLCENFIWHGDI